LRLNKLGYVLGNGYDELLVISDCTDSLHVQQQILGHDRCY